MMLGVANVLCRRTRILACLSSVSAETLQALNLPKAPTERSLQGSPLPESPRSRSRAGGPRPGPEQCRFSASWVWGLRV